MIDNKEGNNHSGHSRNTHQKPQDPAAQPTAKPHQQSAPPLPDMGQTDEIPF
jgi:hypothetical protein